MFSAVEQESIGSQFSSSQTSKLEYKILSSQPLTPVKIFSSSVLNPYKENNQSISEKMCLLTDKSDIKKPTDPMPSKNSYPEKKN